MPSSHLILCRPVLLLPPIPPASESFPVSQLFTWGGQSTGASALASFLPKKSQGWSPSEWTGWISLQSKGLSRVFSNTTAQKHQFFSAQPSSQSNSPIHTWLLEKPYVDIWYNHRTCIKTVSQSWYPSVNQTASDLISFPAGVFFLSRIQPRNPCCIQLPRLHSRLSFHVFRDVGSFGECWSVLLIYGSAHSLVLCVFIVVSYG